MKNISTCEGGLACIVGSATVVGGGEEGDEVALGKALKAIHDALVRAHYHLQVVGLRHSSAQPESHTSQEAMPQKHSEPASPTPQPCAIRRKPKPKTHTKP